MAYMTISTMKKCVTVAILLIQLLAASTVLCQKDTATTITYSAYGELYYAYDFDHPANHVRPAFTYNHVRHNEVNVNLAYVKASILNPNYRANLAAMVGTYAQYNLAAEPDWAQHTFEANIGAKLFDKWNVWVDAGIMPSHIGFESAIGADCWTLTRSIVAENSPYYEAGMKLSGSNRSGSWSYALMYLNGWQTVFKPEGRDKPAFGGQLTYRPNDKTTLNYSNFYGSVYPDEIEKNRHYHNFYLTSKLSTKTSYTIGLDIGVEFDKDDYSTWFAPQIVVKSEINSKHSLAFRLEGFLDEDNVLMMSPDINRANNILGNSLNWDVKVNDSVLWRIEAKNYAANTRLFDTDFSNTVITTALCVKM
jgi:hypothetical protein